MSYVYFILFIVIIQIMMLNLFTAVVLEGFSSSNKEHTGTVTSEHYNELITHWQTYDKSGSGWITLRDLIFLLFELNAPFGFNNEYIKFQASMNMNDDHLKREGKIIDKNMKYIVHKEKNMIVPFKEALKVFKTF